jgi:hypothetical protein
MDYVSDKIIITNESREDKAATLLAYDVAFAAMKKKREENRKHA